MAPAVNRGPESDDAPGERPGEEGDVLAALAERRDPDHKTCEPGIQVSTEAPGLDLAGQIAVCGGHDPDVHRNGLDRADREDLALLEHTQETRLSLGRKVRDLVEEQGPAVRGPKETEARLARVRKRTAHVAEQGRIHQGRGGSRRR